MQLHLLSLLLPLVFAVPALVVEHGQTDPKFVDIRIEGLAESYEQCLESGLEVRYRYELQLCKRRANWFDWCGPTRLATRRIAYDPISESYTVYEDLHDDGNEPTARNLRSLQEVLSIASVVRGVSLEHIAAGAVDNLKTGRAYVSVRLSTDCHGSYNKTLARISGVLTLGMVEYGGFDSGWVDFSLKDILQR